MGAEARGGGGVPVVQMELGLLRVPGGDGEAEDAEGAELAGCDPVQRALARGRGGAKRAKIEVLGAEGVDAEDRAHGGDGGPGEGSGGEE